MPNGIRVFQNVVAANHRSARCRRKQSRQHPDERRLAGTIRSEQRENFAMLHREGNSVDRCKVSKTFRDLVNFDVAHLYSTGSSMYVVIPTARRRSLLSTRNRTSKVLMSRFVRLTSRWVAKPASRAR